MLKIAIITLNYKPYSGGVVSSIDSFCSILKNLGHEILIITLDFLGDIKQEEGVIRINCPIKFIYKNKPLSIAWQADKEVFQIIKNFSPDIIHSQHPFLLGVSAFKSAKKLNIPIVFTYHTRYEQYLHYVPFPKIITNRLLEKRIVSYCSNMDAIIAPSKSICDLLKLKNLNKNIEIIPSGILPIYLNEKFSEKNINEKFNLLTVSRFNKEKNLYFLLDVFSKLDQNKFVFTLIGFGAELPSLKDYAFKKLNLSEENIKFIEKPEKEIIASFYKHSDLFIFSSVSETQGLVLAEAMGGGTPIIGLNGSGICDIIKNSFNGFLVNNQHEMIEKIEEYANNQQLQKEMQYNAWLTSKEYDPRNTTNKLLNFYNQIINSYKK